MAKCWRNGHPRREVPKRCQRGAAGPEEWEWREISEAYQVVQKTPEGIQLKDATTDGCSLWTQTAKSGAGPGKQKGMKETNWTETTLSGSLALTGRKRRYAVGGMKAKVYSILFLTEEDWSIFAGGQEEMENTRMGGARSNPVGSNQLKHASQGHEAQPPLDRLLRFLWSLSNPQEVGHYSGRARGKEEPGRGLRWWLLSSLWTGQATGYEGGGTRWGLQISEERTDQRKEEIH